MRHYITFSLCDETGEADLTPKSKKLVEELAGLGLISADWFGDIHGIAEGLYERAVNSWIAEMADFAEIGKGE